MDRVLPRRLDWRSLAIAAATAPLIAWNISALVSLAEWFPGHHGFDWQVITEAAAMDNPYAQPWYVWSPLAVYPVKALAWVGEPGLWAIHVALLIPLGWPIGALAFISWPFWFDLYLGNVLMLVAVTGYLAVRGSRAAAIAFCILALLMPRPLMLPLLGWLLWREPWTRRPFAVLFALSFAAVLATGFGPAWVDRLMHLPGVMENDGNLAPSQWIGYAWWPIGLVLAAIAFRRGWVGVASVLVQPYVWPHYLLLLIIDARRAPSSR